MRRAAWTAFLLLAAASLGAPPADAKLERAAGRALDYLEAHAATAGSLAANVAEAAAANGLDPSAWPEGDPVAARVAVPGEGASNVSLLRPLRALALAKDPRMHDLAARAWSHVQASGYGDPRTVNDDAYAILALSAAEPAGGAQRFAPMVEALHAAQHPSGGWGWAVGGAPGTDTTGLAVEALLAGDSGRPGEGREAILGFLASTRDPRGGYAETPGGTRNCESTVWGLRASHRLTGAADPDDWDFLLGLQRPDGGFAHVAGGRSDLLCTTEAAGLLGEHAVPAGSGGRGIPALAPPALALLLATVAAAMSTRLREA